MSRSKGFTLIELMIVVAIISILATVALPSYQDRVIQAQVNDAIHVAEIATRSVSELYAQRGNFPAGNTAAGTYVESLKVDNGAIHITLGKRANKNASGKTLSLRPAIVSGERKVPVAWVCGNAAPPEGMKVVGENLTSLPAHHLPIDCRV
jgi:type IV pilus assembly protein PilA